MHKWIPLSIHAEMILTYLLTLGLIGLASFVRALTQLNISTFPTSQILNTPYPYQFPVFDQDGEDTCPFPMEKCHGITLEEATIDELQELMNNGNLSSVKLVTCYLQRIQQTDSFIRYLSISQRPQVSMLIMSKSDNGVEPGYDANSSNP